MRTCLVLLLACLAFSSIALGQATVPDSSWPETSHDFGTVPRGALLMHRVPWHNPTKQRMEITDLRTSCGCLTAKPAPRVLEPGQSGFLEIEMDGRRFTGSKTVFVQLLISPGPVAKTLQIHANSRQDLVFNPGELKFGVVPAGATPKQQVDIEYAGQLAWKIEGIEKLPPHLDASVEELYRRPGQVGYRLTATLKDTAPPGDYKQHIILRTNDPSEPTIAVLAEGTLRAAVLATPNPVNFGSTRVGKMASRRLTLRSDRPFQITKMEGGEGIAPVFAASPGNVQVVTLQWTPAAAGEMRQELTIGTDLPNCPEVKVTLAGTAK